MSTIKLRVPEHVNETIQNWCEVNIDNEDYYPLKPRITNTMVTLAHNIPSSEYQNIKSTINTYPPLFDTNFEGLYLRKHEYYETLIILVKKSQSLVSMRSRIDSLLKDRKSNLIYVPHCVIAYLKPNVGKRILEKSNMYFNGFIFNIYDVQYTDENGQSETFRLTRFAR